MNSLKDIQQDHMKGATCTRCSSAPLHSSESSKSDSPRHVEKLPSRSSISRSGTIRSSLTASGLSKTSKLSNMHQIDRSHLPTGTTPSANTPNVNSSLNTSMQSEGVVCRICHDGDRSEVLVSPCYCAGTMGLLHLSCLQRWLGSSNKTSCEICHFEFALQRRALPISQFLKNPGSFCDRKIMTLYLLNIFLLTPVMAILTGMLFYGSSYLNETLERIGLIIVGVAAVVFFSLSFAYSVRQILRMYKDWRMFHYQVILLCKPSDESKKDTDQVNKQTETQIPESISKSTLGSVRLQSIKVSVTGPMTKYKRTQEQAAPSSATSSQTTRHQNMSDCSSDRSRGNTVQGYSRQSMSSKNHMARRKLPEHKRHFKHQTGDDRTNWRHDEKGLNIANNGSVHHYNAEERAQNLRAGNFHQTYTQCQFHSSCNSGCSSNFTQDSRQRRPLRTLDETTERKSFVHQGMERNLTNKSNMLKGPHEYYDMDKNPGNMKADLQRITTDIANDIFSNEGNPHAGDLRLHNNLHQKMQRNLTNKSYLLIDTPENIDMDTNPESTKSDVEPMTADMTQNVFSRGGSPPDEDLHNNLTYVDFVGKWINDVKSTLEKKKNKH